VSEDEIDSEELYNGQWEVAELDQDETDTELTGSEEEEDETGFNTFQVCTPPA
jgi:hypothetical protein